MTLEKQAETIEFKVAFPCEKAFRISFNGSSGFALKSTQTIGGEVALNIGSVTLATIAYSEDLTQDFTLEDYEQRAKKHAEDMVDKIIKAAQLRTAVDLNVEGIIKNANQNLAFDS